MSSKSRRNFFDECSHFLAKKKAMGNCTNEKAVEDSGNQKLLLPLKDPVAHRYRLVSRVKTKEHVCKICQKEFQKKQGLTQHMISHSLARPHTCHICQHTFKSKASWRTHLKRHAITLPYPCSFCPKKFGSRGNLNCHLLVHAGKQNSLKKVICNVCQKAWKSKKELLVHSVVHSGMKPFSCDQCDMTFATKSNLARHLRRRHKLT